VIFPKNFNNKLLNDSKKLTPGQRSALRVIIEKQALAFAVGQVNHQRIDQINILNASILAMHQAIDKLAIRPQCLLIDGNRFKNYPNTPHYCIVKGDEKYQSIAAASILAKTYRDEFMEQLHKGYPRYNWRANKGYPTPQHRAQIQKSGPTPYHRMSFRLLAAE